jgi:hypothetical protein
MVYNSNISNSNASTRQINNTPSSVMQGLRQPTQQTQASLPQAGISNSILNTNQYGGVTDFSSMIAPKPSNHLVAKAALMGATLAVVGPLAAPMLGNMAKSAFGFVKNFLPQASEAASHVLNSDTIKNIVGNVASNVISSKLSR